jgi:hypothetical protein
MTSNFQVKLSKKIDFHQNKKIKKTKTIANVTPTTIEIKILNH